MSKEKAQQWADVVRSLGSLSAAARKIGVSRQAVGKMLKKYGCIRGDSIWQALHRGSIQGRKDQRKTPSGGTSR